MTHSPTIVSRALAAIAFAVASIFPAIAGAEKADREKPIQFSAEQPAEVDFDKRVGTLRGNVVITQGTLTIHADRIDFKQNSDDSLSATAWGNPVTFRQKKDDSDEYFEGFAQSAVYDGQTQTLQLFDRALLKQGKNEIRSNYVSYNSATSLFKAEGRPDAPGVEGPGARVRGVFEPHTDSPLTGKAPSGANGKDSAAPPAGSASTPEGKSAKPAANAAPPLKLTPDPTLPAK